METREVLTDAFERVREGVHRLCDGLDDDALTWQPDPGANSIAWLVWHLARIGDAQVADLAEREQVWTADGWVQRFDLSLDTGDTGFGHGPDEVAAVRPGDPGLLAGYVDAVVDATQAHLETIDADEFDRVVDRSWDPPVTAGVRLVSIVNDQAQHLGQAAYVRGLHDRSGAAQTS